MQLYNTLCTCGAFDITCVINPTQQRKERQHAYQMSRITGGMRLVYSGSLQ